MHIEHYCNDWSVGKIAGTWSVVWLAVNWMMLVVVWRLVALQFFFRCTFFGRNVQNKCGLWISLESALNAHRVHKNCTQYLVVYGLAKESNVITENGNHIEIYSCLSRLAIQFLYSIRPSNRARGTIISMYSLRAHVKSQYDTKKNGSRCLHLIKALMLNSNVYWEQQRLCLTGISAAVEFSSFVFLLVQ